MSDIVIKNMEMPKSCCDCQICFSHLGDLCPVTSDMIAGKGGKFFLDKRHPNCPLVELPPHGRLGDLDKLKKQVSASITDRDRMYGTYDKIEMIIENAPTILEASKEE